ncbi:hypothetical protein [Umezawaea sp.]|uniref:hypothetical protein n=1 Tax=Umezawaea sp. TaxID=1955258 RepID=UPI002ED6A88B
MKAIRTALVAVATLFALGSTVLVTVPAASAGTATTSAVAPEVAPPAPMATPAGCDGFNLPSATPVYFASYDPWLGFNACTQCDWDATLMASFGYRTWCWETVRDGQRAELWLGSIVQLGGAGEVERFTRATEDQLADLRRAAADGRGEHLGAR